VEEMYARSSREGAEKMLKSEKRTSLGLCDGLMGSVVTRLSGVKTRATNYENDILENVANL